MKSAKFESAIIAMTGSREVTGEQLEGVIGMLSLCSVQREDGEHFDFDDESVVSICKTVRGTFAVCDLSAYF